MEPGTAFGAPGSFPLRGKAGMGAATALAGVAPLGPPPHHPPTRGGAPRPPPQRLPVACSAMEN
jgi:hypothetical protein